MLNNIIKKFKFNFLKTMIEKKSAIKVLEETSRTFFIPIMRLPRFCQ